MVLLTPGRYELNVEIMKSIKLVIYVCSKFRNDLYIFGIGRVCDVVRECGVSEITL